MPVTVHRKNTIFQPDSGRVIARFFNSGDERSIKLIKRLLQLDEKEQQEILVHVLRDFSQRHRSISRAFEKNFNRLTHLFDKAGVDPEKITTAQKVLIGSYFTMEYSIEAAAFFNPSIVEDPDQSGLAKDEKRIIISFRATGEGHVSSIVFRAGIIDRKNNIMIEPPGRWLETPAHVNSHIYHKNTFTERLKSIMKISESHYQELCDKLGDSFTYDDLKAVLDEMKETHTGNTETQYLKEIRWLAKSHYKMDFSVDTSISERVIFPIADTEIKGIEDARFVRFTNDEGEVTYYATYSAYDGRTVLPKLLRTKDFYHFSVHPLNGEASANKGMALFPRKVNGQYVMMCRSDGMNNYISFSDDITTWKEAKMIEEPAFSWDFVQLGNCGSPIETEAGWLLLTHGVGPVREYSIGASLLDLNDPSKVIGRLKKPLISPNEKEREGYVPNVVYSCGAMVHNGHLVIPYAMSDYASTYATVNLQELIDELKKAGKP